MRNILYAMGLVLLAFLLQSHEFWLQPSKFILDSGEVFNMDIRVGEEYKGELWDYRNERIVGFYHYNGENKNDLTKKAKKGEGDNLRMKFDTPGLQLLALETNSAFIELEGFKFNDYLEEDGLDDALNHRKENGLLDKKGSEFYARNIKCLVKVGDVNDDTYKAVVGMPMEIIPLQDPYKIDGGGNMDFEVRFLGKPLENALVKVWHKIEENTKMKEVRSNSNGTVNVDIQDTGIWMVSAVQMVISEKQGADWQSYWASLTFGFE